MLPPDILISFTLAAFLVSLAPGPDNIFVLTQSALNGAKAGIIVVFGLCTGLLVHCATVALGLAALIKTSAIAFTILKLIGACYLLFLAYKAFTAKGQKLGDDTTVLKAGELYRRGLIMNVTNPKVAIFFLALFPQFMEPGQDNFIIKIAQLGMIFVAITFIIFVFIALIAGSLRNWLLSSPKAQAYINKIAGLVFVGLAAKIAFNDQ